MQASAFYDQQEHWKYIWRPEETFCLSDSRESPSANAGVKISQNNNLQKR